MASRPIVITVHGLNSDGEWQDGVEHVLSPFCDCRKFRYPHYRFFGFLLQFVHPGWILFAISAAAFWYDERGPAVPASTDRIISEGTLEWLYGHRIYWSPFLILSGIIANLLSISESRRSFKMPSPPAPKRTAYLIPILLAIFVILSSLTGIQAANATQYSMLGTSGTTLNWSRVAFAAMGFVLVSLADRLSLSWRITSIALTLIAGIGAFAVAASDVLLVAMLGNLLLQALVIFDICVPLFRLLKTWLFPIGLSFAAIALGGSLHQVCVSFDIQTFGIGKFPLSLLFSVIALIIAFVESRRYRNRCVAFFTSWITSIRKQHPDAKIHIIAHSLGSYLTGRFIRDESKKLGIRIERVILVGSVLPACFPWSQLLQETAHGCEQIRNEVGERDPIVLFAGLTEKFPMIRRLGFGSGGRTGFNAESPELPEAAFFHHVRNSLDYCEECLLPDHWQLPRVHNVYLPTFRHSDATSSLERAERFWLPYLLGHDPWQYWDFRRLCRQAAVLDERINEQNKGPSDFGVGV